ncbi:MAG: glycosyltransferase family protein [Opitutaceae bacterium]|jgi:uncharacterized protein (TIGR00661 family)
MNIVYALSGEGRGHASTARSVLPVIEGAGHRLKVVTYGRSVGLLEGYDLLEIRGIHHHYNRSGRLSLARSFAGNAGVLVYYLRNWRSLRQKLRAFSPDLFIVNFEPLSPLLARSLGVPFISFDNQHALVFLEQRVPPGFRFSSAITRTAARIVAAGADAYVVMSLAPPGRCPGNVRVVPPPVQDEFRRLRPESGDYVLVYLKEPNPSFLRVLRQVDQRFVVYGYNLDATDGNLTFRAFNDGMPRELAGCKAAMGTSGLSFIAETIWLRKPFFGVPLKNEFEQTANSLFIRETGLGDFSESPVREEVERFFLGLEAYRAPLAEFRFDPDAAGHALLELAENIPAPTGNPAPAELHA